MIAFLRDVWIEENLSLCEQFDSTEKVRSERLAVLQLLVTWDANREGEYAEAIKDLTIDQTLQRGLIRMDQSRIFVNESGISRWAEKELLQDYERWDRLRQSGPGAKLIDDLLRQYAVDPQNDQALKEFSSGVPTVADALLIGIVDRLYRRFVQDPSDGLDSYLSLRIRHGTLKGTVLGPLEEHALLYSASGFSREAFDTRWSRELDLAEQSNSIAMASLTNFSTRVLALMDDLISQRIQLCTIEKPHGVFQTTMPAGMGKLLASGLAVDTRHSFYTFLVNVYFLSWKVVELGLNEIGKYIKGEFKDKLQALFDELVGTLRQHQGALPLITRLTSVATATRAQCDAVSDWFRLPGQESDERYHLPSAIDIARVATINVHRAFPAEVRQCSLPEKDFRFTASALSLLTDCLCVIFENAWKHSGLGGKVGPLDVDVTFEDGHNVLTLSVRSNLSCERRASLDQGGGLLSLRSKYLGELPVHLVSREGGSGFPKLARYARYVPVEATGNALDFGIDEGQWYTRVSVPLYEKDGVYDAYF
jgi:hypothetical protein